MLLKKLIVLVRKIESQSLWLFTYTNGIFHVEFCTVEGNTYIRAVSLLFLSRL